MFIQCFLRRSLLQCEVCSGGDTRHACQGAHQPKANARVSDQTKSGQEVLPAIQQDQEGPDEGQQPGEDAEPRGGVPQGVVGQGRQGGHTPGCVHLEAQPAHWLHFPGYETFCSQLLHTSQRHVRALPIRCRCSEVPAFRARFPVPKVNKSQLRWEGWQAKVGLRAFHWHYDLQVTVLFLAMTRPITQPCCNGTAVSPRARPSSSLRRTSSWCGGMRPSTQTRHCISGGPFLRKGIVPIPMAPMYHLVYCNLAATETIVAELMAVFIHFLTPTCIQVCDARLCGCHWREEACKGNDLLHQVSG